jgi:hypothetical protein
MDKKLPVHLARRIATAAGDADPRTVQKVYAGKPVRGAVGDRIRSALRAAGLLVAVLCSQGCESSRAGIHLAALDAGPDGLAPPSRGTVGVDLLPGDDAGSTVGLDSLATDLRAFGPDAVPASATEVGLDVLVSGDVGVDVIAAREVGQEAPAADGPPPLPETCTSVQVKAGDYCPGYWPGTNPPVLCAPGCRDYAAWVNGAASTTITIAHPLLGCNSYDMTSPTTGHPVVCLAGESFCAIYCPVVK